MKPQKSLTRDQLDRVPEPLRDLVAGVQMNSPAALGRLLDLAIQRLGGLTVTPQDAAPRSDRGLLTIGVTIEPPALKLFFLPGDPEVLADQLANRFPGKPLFPIDPALAEDDPEQ